MNPSTIVICIMLNTGRMSSVVAEQIDTALEVKAPSLLAEDAEGQPKSDLAAGDARNEAVRDSGSNTCVEPNNERSGGCGAEVIRVNVNAVVSCSFVFAQIGAFCARPVDRHISSFAA